MTLRGEVLATLPVLPIACYALFLLLLPVALTPVVVAISIGAIDGHPSTTLRVTFSITFPLLVLLLPARGALLLLLKPASLFGVTVWLLRTLRALLRLAYLLLALLLPTLLTLLGLMDLLLTLLLGTLTLLILTLDVATLFLRLLVALSLLFPALLTLLAVLLLLLTLLLPALLAFLAVALLFLPTLLMLNLRFAAAFALLRWLGRLPFFTTAWSVLLLLFSLGLVLASLLTPTTSALSIGKVSDTQ